MWLLSSYMACLAQTSGHLVVGEDEQTRCELSLPLCWGHTLIWHILHGCLGPGGLQPCMLRLHTRTRVNLLHQAPCLSWCTSSPIRSALLVPPCTLPDQSFQSLALAIFSNPRSSQISGHKAGRTQMAPFAC